MNLAQTETGEGNERTTEVPILGTEATQDLPVTPVVSAITGAGDIEHLVQTILLDCGERIEAAVQRLNELLSLLVEETLEALEDEKRIQEIAEIEKIVTTAMNCLKSESIEAWTDSDPEICALNLPAIKIDKNGIADTSVQTTEGAPVMLMQRALSILTPLDERMDGVARKSSIQTPGHRPITFLQKAHLLIKQAIVLLRVH